jgi:hypothetical protein
MVDGRGYLMMLSFVNVNMCIFCVGGIKYEYGALVG